MSDPDQKLDSNPELDPDSELYPDPLVRGTDHPQHWFMDPQHRFIGRVLISVHGINSSVFCGRVSVRCRSMRRMNRRAQQTSRARRRRQGLVSRVRYRDEVTHGR